MATVRDILARKGSRVFSVTVDDSVMTAARLMNERKIGGVVVTDEGQMVGIFTERDILRSIVAEPRDPTATTVREVMTSPVATCRSETSVDECVAVMTRKSIRHLPVVDDQSVCGIVTSSDILAFQVTE